MGILIALLIISVIANVIQNMLLKGCIISSANKLKDMKQYCDKLKTKVYEYSKHKGSGEVDVIEEFIILEHEEKVS